MLKTAIFPILAAIGLIGGLMANEPVRVAPEVAAKNLLDKVEPKHPALAQTLEIDGTVALDVTISPEGKVTGVKPLGGNPVILMPVLYAVQQWRYKPFLLNDRPIEVITRVEWTFPAPPRTKAQQDALRDYYPAFETCAGLVRAGGQDSEAEKKCSAAIALADELPAGRIIERSSSRTFFAHALLHQRKFDQSIPVYQKALEIRATMQGMESDADFAGCNANLARAWFLAGKFDKADPLYARAVIIFEAAIAHLPEEQEHYIPWLRTTLLEYAKLKTDSGEPDRARELEQKAAALKTK